jgi:hypothetical protein
MIQINLNPCNVKPVYLKQGILFLYIVISMSFVSLLSWNFLYKDTKNNKGHFKEFVDCTSYILFFAICTMSIHLNLYLTKYIAFHMCCINVLSSFAIIVCVIFALITMIHGWVHVYDEHYIQYNPEDYITFTILGSISLVFGLLFGCIELCKYKMVKY